MDIYVDEFMNIYVEIKGATNRLPTTM